MPSDENPCNLGGDLELYVLLGRYKYSPVVTKIKRTTFMKTGHCKFLSFFHPIRKSNKQSRQRTNT